MLTFQCPSFAFFSSSSLFSLSFFAFSSSFLLSSSFCFLSLALLSTYSFSTSGSLFYHCLSGSSLASSSSFFFSSSAYLYLFLLTFALSLPALNYSIADLLMSNSFWTIYSTIFNLSSYFLWTSSFNRFMSSPSFNLVLSQTSIKRWKAASFYKVFFFSSIFCLSSDRSSTSSIFNFLALTIKLSSALYLAPL